MLHAASSSSLPQASSRSRESQSADPSASGSDAWASCSTSSPCLPHSMRSAGMPHYTSREQMHYSTHCINSMSSKLALVRPSRLPSLHVVSLKRRSGEVAHADAIHVARVHVRRRHGLPHGAYSAETERSESLGRKQSNLALLQLAAYGTSSRTALHVVRTTAARHTKVSPHNFA